MNDTTPSTNISAAAPVVTETGATVAAPAQDTTSATASAPQVTETAPSESPAPAETSPEPAGAPEPAAEPVADDGVESVLGDAPEKKADAATPTKDDKATSEKAADASDPSGDKKPEGEAAPVELPKYEFKLPENVQMDEAQMGEFSKLIGEIETGKLDHEALQGKAQSLVDMHIKGVTESIERLNKYYENYHTQQKRDWFDSFAKDPQLGGSEEKVAATVSKVRGAIEEFGGEPGQIAEFRKLMKETGVGNHPAMIRLLSNMSDTIAKYTTEKDNGNDGTNRIVQGTKPAPGKTKDYQRFYGGGQ